MIPLTKEYGEFIFGEQKDSQDDSPQSSSVSKESQENEENEENDEKEYREGAKVVGKHTRYERSKKLPKAFFEQLKHPYFCEMCERSVVEMYPGLSNEEAARLIEGHHPLQISKGERNTKVSDLMALCPTCHRLVHRAMAKFFKDHNLKDFESSEQENDFYKELRKKFTTHPV